jgi:hypothetical protein
MKRIPGLLLSAFVIFSVTAQTAPIDPKLTALYAQDNVIEVELFSTQWDNLRNQDPRGGRCVFGFIGPEYDWFRFEDVRINGIRFHDVGVKKRAWCGSESKTKPSLNIKFDKFDKRQGNVAVNAMGLDNLLLNNSAQDLAYVRQCMAYRLWAKAGVAAPLCNFAHVRVNNQDMGVYVNVQPMGTTLLQAHYSGELGNLYEIAADDFDDSSRDHLKASMDSLKKEEDRSLSEIKAITAALDARSGSMKEIEKLVDLDEFFDYWAMEIILSHFDGFTLSNNNAYLYFPPHGKMQILPWGADNVLTRISDRETRQIYNFNRLARKLSESTAMRQRLLDTIDHQMRLLWNEKDLREEIDHAAFVIGRFIPAREQGDFFGEIAVLKKNIHLRREQIASLILVDFNEIFNARLQNAKGYRFCLNTQVLNDNRVTNVWGCGDDPDQRWDVTYVMGDNVRLRNPALDNCVDVQRVSAGAPVDARTCNGLPNQNWKVIVNSGAYLFESQTVPGSCLSLGEEEDSGQTVIKSCDRNDPAQNWRRFFTLGE